MRRLFHWGRRGLSSRLADERGFTLIELLVSMLVSLIVLGGGTYGLAQAFRQTNEVTGRTASTSQAEVGLQQMTHDLQFATPCPTFNNTNVLGAGSHAISGLLISSGPTLQMCDPIAGAHSTQPPPLAVVTWTCNLASTSETCTRSLTSIFCPGSGGTTVATGPCTTGAPSLSTSSSSTAPIRGVSSLGLSGIVSGANQASLLSGSACLLVTGYQTYGLVPGSTCPLNWVGIQAQVVNLADSGSPTDAANSALANKTTPIQIQTGVALANYGT
jgi:prepilin-type N-terminal cleavage/methylation domain-containing protein